MNRGQRIDDLVRGELARLLLREIKDPRVQMASVTSVSTSRDLKRAVVRVSVLGDDGDRQACIDALVKARGFLRGRMAKSLRLRTVPELVFELDRGAEHSMRISAILGETR